ncbi:MAG: ATP-binding cassette domain-containing protein [Deltaproteobacteria bacterium]|nr:ATP-binding cassette domain-containing protein [Deltaproteobacteria bacterium]
MVEVRNLAKSYGSFQALRGISFDVPHGQVLGFLGPNGAGKTTTMKILTTFLAATSGGARVGGKDIAQAPLAVRHQLGYLPEDTPIYPDMTVLEYLRFVGDLREIERGEQRRRIASLAESCGLLRVLGKPIAQLSKGLRQRAGLAQAMIHDPALLILDEPTSGLDPNQIVEIRELIKELGKEKTVILSTHILPEVQATCGRVIIINEGELVADGTPTELAADQHENAFRLLIDAGEVDARAVRGKLRQIKGIDRIRDIDGEKEALGFIVEAQGDRDLRRELFTCAIHNDWVLLELARQEVSLEDVFRKLTR